MTSVELEAAVERLQGPGLPSNMAFGSKVVFSDDLRTVLSALSASNARALAAEEALRVAEDFIEQLGRDIHHERCGDWYPEGANNAALQMSEAMRLLGNRCADFDALASMKEVGRG